MASLVADYGDSSSDEEEQIKHPTPSNVPSTTPSLSKTNATVTEPRKEHTIAIPGKTSSKLFSILPPPKHKDDSDASSAKKGNNRNNNNPTPTQSNTTANKKNPIAFTVPINIQSKNEDEDDEESLDEDLRPIKRRKNVGGGKLSFLPAPKNVDSVPTTTKTTSTPPTKSISSATSKPTISTPTKKPTSDALPPSKPITIVQQLSKIISRDDDEEEEEDTDNNNNNNNSDNSSDNRKEQDEEDQESSNDKSNNSNSNNSSSSTTKANPIQTTKKRIPMSFKQMKMLQEEDQGNNQVNTSDASSNGPSQTGMELITRIIGIISRTILKNNHNIYLLLLLYLFFFQNLDLIRDPLNQV